MGISLSYPTISPTKPRTAYLEQMATQNTWYTLLDVTSGSGILNKIIIASSVGGTTNSKMQIRITVDGVESTITGSTSALYSRGLVHYMLSGAAEYNGGCAFYYNSPIYFYQSLKVEIRHTHSVTTNLENHCDYSII